MTCKVHDAIIAKGFREVRTRAGTARKYGKRYTCYARGAFEVRYVDYGPSKNWPNNPDANRYVMQVFANGVKRHGGTAWQAILASVPELEG